MLSDVTAQQRQSDFVSTIGIVGIVSNIAFCFRCDKQNEHRSIKLHYTFCLAHTASSIRFTFLLEVFLLLPVHMALSCISRYSRCTRSKLLRFSLSSSSCSFDGPFSSLTR